MTSPVFLSVAVPASVGLKRAVMREGCLGLQSQMPGSDKGKPMALIVGSYSHQNRGLLLSPNTAIHARVPGVASLGCALLGSPGLRLSHRP